MIKQHAVYIENPDMFEGGYTGYINISGNKVFKSFDKQNEELIPSHHPQAITYTSPYYTDWGCDEDKYLPYQLEDILLHPNELVHANVLNKTFEKLYTNLEYIASRNTFYANSIPTTYKGWFGCSINMYDLDDGGARYYISKYSFHNPTKPCYQYYACKFATISGVDSDNDFISGVFGSNITASGAVDDDNVSEYENPDNKYYDTLNTCINFTTKAGKTLSIMFADNSISYNLIDDNGISKYNDMSPITAINGIELKNINSADISESNYLYVSDNGTHNIYQYNLNYIVNDDKVITKPILINIIGGNDATNTKLYKFNNIKFIKCSGDYVFVYDDVEGIIVVFDQFLNYSTTIGNIGALNHKPVSVTYRKLHHEFHILCEDAHVTVIGDDFNTKYSYQLEHIDNICVSIAVSTEDTNVFYVATLSKVYQLLFSNYKIVGAFNFVDYSITNTDLKWWRSTYINWKDCEDLWGGSYNFPKYMNTFIVKNMLVRRTNNEDEIWIFANNGRMLWFRNKVKQISLFSNNTTKLQYTKSDLVCGENEYVQSLTYNRLIRKFIDMLNNFIENISYKPSYYYNADNELVFDQLRYIVDKPNFNDKIKDMRIYDNDILSVDVINRVLTNLFDIEQQILNSTQIEVTNADYQKTQNTIIKL